MSPLMSVHGICKQLSQQPPISSLARLVESLQGGSMDPFWPVTPITELGKLLGVPNIIQKGLEDGLGGGVKVKRFTCGADPDGSCAYLEAIGQHAFPAPVEKAIRAVGRLIEQAAPAEKLRSRQAIGMNFAICGVGPEEPNLTSKPLNETGASKVHGVSTGAGQDGCHGRRKAWRPNLVGLVDSSGHARGSKAPQRRKLSAIKCRGEEPVANHRAIGEASKDE
jgi:hypothetical protein